MVPKFFVVTLAAASTFVAMTALSIAKPILCAKPFERAIAFTSKRPADRLLVEAQGPDCKNPAMFTTIVDRTGRMIFAEMTSGKWLLNAEMFPSAGGTIEGVTQTIFDIGDMTSGQLPKWKPSAKSPPPGSYGAFEVMVPQPYYERLRQSNLPILIKRGGGESGTMYVYDAENAQAVAIAKYAV